MQFHPELNGDALEGWLREGGRDEVLSDGQNPDAMLAHTRAEEPAATPRTYALVDAFLEKVARLAPSRVA